MAPMYLGRNLTVSEALASIFKTFQEADTLYRQLKLYCLARHIPLPPIPLERAIAEAPNDIARTQQRYLSRFGQSFDQGDQITIIALQQATIQLHRGLLDGIRHALENPQGTDYVSIIDDTDDARDGVLAALASLRQRLASAGAPSNASPTSLSNASVDTRADPWRTKSLPDPPSIPSRDTRRKPVNKQSPQELDSYQVPRPDAAISAATNAALSNTTSARGAVPRLAKLSIFPKVQAVELPAQQHDSVLRTKRSGIIYARSSETNLSDARGPARSRAASIDSTHSGDSYLDYFNEYVDAPRANTLRVLAPSPSITSTKSHDSRPDSTSLSPITTRVVSTSSTAAKSPSSATTKSPASATTKSLKSTTSKSPQPATTPTLPPLPTLSPRKTVPSIPEPLLTPTAKNNYLGFCKGAHMAQEEDSKAMTERREFTIAGQPPSHHLACSKCNFRGETVSQAIWGGVIVDDVRRLKYRWTFLAKSHTKQKFAIDRSLAGFQCLFCVLRGGELVAFKREGLLDHIADVHRGEVFGEELRRRTNFVGGRVCGDEEEFDINVYPE